MGSEGRSQQFRQLGRYAMYGVIGSGGMATVHFGRLLGPSGFARPVAIKRLHEQFASDRAFVDMLIDEAHTASRIAHTNVVPTLDVLAEQGELWLVMEYVNGESLARLLDGSAGRPLPVPVAAGLITGVLHGLHAAHETRGEAGELLGIVHRDVSPDNVLVGVDGVPRLADFGVAKARGRLRTTPAGQVKGKLAYMPPEQIRGGEVDRRVDVYGAGVVLWETLCGRMLFSAASDGELIHRVLHEPVRPPSELNPKVPPALDGIALRALSHDPSERFASAREMASALEASLRVASQSELADWLQQVAGAKLAQRAALLRTMVDVPAQAQVETRDYPLPLSAPDGPSTRVTPSERSSTRERAHTPAPARSPLWLWVGVVLLVLLSLVGGAWFFARSPALAPLPSPESPVAPPAAPLPEGRPLEEKVPAKAAREEVAPAKVAPAREPRRRARRMEKPAEVDCSPPYYLDADGIRHVKSECL